MSLEAKDPGSRKASQSVRETGRDESQSAPSPEKLGGRFGYFLFFCLLRGGRGSSRVGGGRFVLKISGGGGGGVSRKRGGGVRRGPGGCLRGIGGGGCLSTTLLPHVQVFSGAFSPPPPICFAQRST